METRFFNPWAETTVGRNRLPHWGQPGAAYFLTFHLADSLPAGLISQWTIERENWLAANPEPWTEELESLYHKRFTAAKEAWLDEGHGECLLRRPELREAVARVFTLFDHDRYWHHAWVVMPNHAHLLVTLKEGVVLSKQMNAWKGVSSRAVGKLLGRRMSEEAFWQKDYFDRLIRDSAHFWNCARYIRNNPEKAKLRPHEFTLHLSDHVRETLMRA